MLKLFDSEDHRTGELTVESFEEMDLDVFYSQLIQDIPDVLSLGTKLRGVDINQP